MKRKPMRCGLRNLRKLRLKDGTIAFQVKRNMLPCEHCHTAAPIPICDLGLKAPWQVMAEVVWKMSMATFGNGAEIISIHCLVSKCIGYMTTSARPVLMRSIV